MFMSLNMDLCIFHSYELVEKHERNCREDTQSQQISHNVPPDLTVSTGHNVETKEEP